MTTIGTWALKLSPGKPHKFDAFPSDEDSGDDLILRISNAALGETLADEGRTVVKITKMKSPFDGDEEESEDENPKKKKGGKKDEEKEDSGLEEYVLCSLLPGKIEQVLLNMEFGPELVQFEVVGKNEVHLLGNWVDNAPDQPPFGSDDEDDSDDELEGAHRLQDVSSDVEMDPEDLDDLEGDETDGSRFEELTANGDVKKSLKRAADDMDEDVPGADGLSKKQKKKLAKKLKNAEGDGVAVSAASVTSVTSITASPDAKKKEKKEKKDDKKEKSDGEEKKGSDKGMTTLPGGLMYQDAKKGTGKTAKKGSTLSMRYIGKLENGKVFDKNTGGTPFRFRLGQGEVIKGWDQGLVGMQVGGERVLIIPPALAYGAKGSKPEIPANATLKFEVKLLEVK